MGNFPKTVLFSSFFIIYLFSTSYAQNCSSFTFSNNNNYVSCSTLPALNSFLHWNYNPSNRTIDVAYRHTGITDSNWVAWSLNPSGGRMVGAQGLVAFLNSSGVPHAYTSPISGYGTRLEEGPLSFRVPRLAAERVGDQTIIYATIQLPAGGTIFTHVWQHGDLNGGRPQQHPTTAEHLRSFGTIDFATGTGAAPPEAPTEAPTQPSGNNCPSYRFSNNNNYVSCSPLPALNSFLHWNYSPSNNTIDVAYRHTGITDSNWVVWSLNPNGGRMIGAQCLVAFRNSSGVLHAYTSPISGYTTQLQEDQLSFRVARLAAEHVGDQMIIYATIELPAGRTSFTHVWQHGDLNAGRPQQHPTTGEHLTSFGTIDFATGTTTNTGGTTGGSRQRRRNVHGVLNAVSWGVLMPFGAMVARYLKVFKAAHPAWFYIHVTCQVSAYGVGVAGWGTGLKLGSDSPGVERTSHRNIGITLFALATLQVFALLLRPKPDHKYRFYWNIYHHAIGYSVIILSIINIFKGFDILDPEKKWKRAYIGILICLGVNAVLLEAYTWYIVLKRKRQASVSDKHPHGANGYGA
ncbi:putative membrane protein [Handroanthus impetiginosus]|uniref:Putative membrane protein n=1 Tax=Handroanthus impetiginosus TaxID=429701 RepID=A0A2G9HJ18_9LAMI|nr:putative membrane protein [Handroanthus impetiginosus]